MLKKKIKLHWSFEQIANRNEEEIYIFSTSTIDRMIHIVHGKKRHMKIRMDCVE